MPMQARYFRLGAFILLALVALIALIVVLGTGAFFRKDIVAETYFDESVQGLEVGSKVLFRGVMVGNITRLTFSYVKYEQDKPANQRKPYVLVEFVIRPDLIAANDVGRADLIRIIHSQVEKGLRVREVPQGVTGISYLELDYTDPKAIRQLVVDWQPEHVYIPSTRSTVGRIVSATEALVRRLTSVDVEGFVTNVNALAASLTNKVDSLDLGGISQDAVQLLAELRQTNQRLQRILAASAWDEAPRDIASASREMANAARDAAASAARVREIAQSEEFEKTIAQFQRTLNRLDRMVAGRESDIAVTLNNLRQITDNLRDLSENAKRYPSGVIFGEPPRPEPRGR